MGGVDVGWASPNASRTLPLFILSSAHAGQDARQAASRPCPALTRRHRLPVLRPEGEPPAHRRHHVQPAVEQRLGAGHGKRGVSSVRGVAVLELARAHVLHSSAACAASQGTRPARAGSHGITAGTHRREEGAVCAHRRAAACRPRRCGSTCSQAGAAGGRQRRRPAGGGARLPDRHASLQGPAGHSRAAVQAAGSPPAAAATPNLAGSSCSACVTRVSR